MFSTFVAYAVLIGSTISILSVIKCFFFPSFKDTMAGLDNVNNYSFMKIFILLVIWAASGIFLYG